MTWLPATALCIALAIFSNTDMAQEHGSMKTSPAHRPDNFQASIDAAMSRMNDGMATNDTLFVVDAVNNRIVSFAGVSTATTVLQPTVVFAGAPLNQPAGLAINPLNNDLLAVNQGDNNLVEISLPSSSMYQGTLVGTKTLDPTAVVKGVGAALFGLTATKDASGNLMVYFTNDNNNTVQVLKK